MASFFNGENIAIHWGVFSIVGRLPCLLLLDWRYHLMFLFPRGSICINHVIINLAILLNLNVGYEFRFLDALGPQERLLSIDHIVLLFLIVEHVHDILGTENIGLKGITTIYSLLYCLLLFGTFHYPLFNCTLGDQPKN